MQQAPRKQRKPNPEQSEANIRDWMRMKRLREAIDGCVVCKLPEPARAQIKLAKAVRATQKELIEFLYTNFGVRVTAADLQRHSKGQHDERKKLLQD